MIFGKPPTLRQTKVLRRLAQFTAEHGFPPSLRQLTAILGFRSTNAITTHLAALERRGLINRSSKTARGVVLTDAGRSLLAQLNILRSTI